MEWNLTRQDISPAGLHRLYESILPGQLIAERWKALIQRGARGYVVYSDESGRPEAFEAG